MGYSKIILISALTFLLLVHPSVQQSKLVDFSVLDVSSKALLRIEHLLAELLDIVSKAVPYHERHIQLLSKQMAANSIPKSDMNMNNGQDEPKTSSALDTSRKSFLSRLHQLENSFDSNANTNLNTNINTNANVRKQRPYRGDYLNDDLI